MLGSVVFHAVENSAAKVPHRGNYFSTLWKNSRVTALFFPHNGTTLGHYFHTVENPATPWRGALQSAGRGAKNAEKFCGVWQTAAVNRRGAWQMSKSMIVGLVILAVFILLLLKADGDVVVRLWSFKRTIPSAYALLAAAGVGVVVGALLRK